MPERLLETPIPTLPFSERVKKRAVRVAIRRWDSPSMPRDASVTPTERPLEVGTCHVEIGVGNRTVPHRALTAADARSRPGTAGDCHAGRPRGPAAAIHEHYRGDASGRLPTTPWFRRSTGPAVGGRPLVTCNPTLTGVSPFPCSGCRRRCLAPSVPSPLTRPHSFPRVSSGRPRGSRRVTLVYCLRSRAVKRSKTEPLCTRGGFLRT